MRSEENDDAANRCKELYRTYYQPMLRVANRYLHDHYLAEDAVQQTFLRLLRYRSWTRSISPGCEWGYLKTALSHECFQMIGRREIPFTEESIQLRTDASLSHMSAENEVLSDYNLKEEMERLPETYAEPLVLHYLRSFSYEEIGVMLNLNPATVRKRSQRGRMLLAKHLKMR